MPLRKRNQWHKNGGRLYGAGMNYGYNRQELYFLADAVREASGTEQEEVYEI